MSNQLTPYQEEKMRLEKFMKALNSPPNDSEIMRNPHAGNIMYLPISYVEMTLDEMFFGLWKTENFRWQVMVNEIVGSLDLHVKHPITGEWIVRTGASATMIRQQKGATISEVDKKIHNALEMDMPHLKADCIVNAARSLGKLFGRDLNRKFTDNYKPLITAAAERNGAITAGQQIQSELDTAKDRCYNILEQARCDDNTENGFRLRIASAETPIELSQVQHEISMYLPDDNPATQFTTRMKQMTGQHKPVVKNPTT